MELHKALRNIIQSDGLDILKEVRLVNILDDFNAYQDIPSSKYMLRAIIVDGYIVKLLKLGKWTPNVERLVNKYSSMTGFIPEYVFLLTASLVYGLGWIDDTSLYQLNNKLSSKSKNALCRQLAGSVVESVWQYDMTPEEKEEYLLSLLEYDNSKEVRLNVKFHNISFDVDNNDRVTIQGELVRLKKIPEDAFPRLEYALYDLKECVKDTGLLHYIVNTDISPNLWWTDGIS